MGKTSFEAVLQRRINFILLFFFAILATLAGRLFSLQIVNHRQYVELAAKQQTLTKELLPERGIIYMQDKKGVLIPLAMNRIKKNLVASPKDIADKEAAAGIISESLGLEREEVLKKLAKENDSYEIIFKDVGENKESEISGKITRGVFFEEEKRRIYPHGALGAHLAGFAAKEGDKEAGRYGLERFYERELSGEKGVFEGVKDAFGFWIALGKWIVRPPKNGASLVLSVDYNIQIKSEQVLKGAFEKWGAVSGSVLVLDPKSGKILADASLPAFDPNEFGKEKNLSVFLNPALESIYEFGSVLKPITMAAALQEGRIKQDSVYEDSGEVKIGSYTIKNFDGRAYGIQTMTQVLEKSLNTGAVFAARLIGKEKHYEYLKKFGFGEKTGVDLPGEVSGDISNLNAGRDIDFATASFGQGIAATPLQLASAIAAVANGGKLMKPYVVEKIIDDSGNEIKKEPQVKREVVSKEAAETLTKMLISAVRNGFENKAGIDGYFVAGKTGTAQIPRRDDPGYSDKVIHTFVGYAPAFNPKFLILLQLNEPQGNRFAANTLTPVFHDLAVYILNYYEIPPDEK